MKPKKETVPPVKAANENKTAAAALAVIITVLGEAIENNREQKRFAADGEVSETLREELASLHGALDWAESAAGKGRGQGK
jgi:hypothetical protein